MCQPSCIAKEESLCKEKTPKSFDRSGDRLENNYGVDEPLDCRLESPSGVCDLLRTQRGLTARWSRKPVGTDKRREGFRLRVAPGSEDTDTNVFSFVRAYGDRTPSGALGHLQLCSTGQDPGRVNRSMDGPPKVTQILCNVRFDQGRHIVR